MNKVDFVLWSRKYDKAFGWEVQRERELGARFRKNRYLSCKDLVAVVEWKFRGAPENLERSLNLVSRNSEEKVMRITSQIFGLPGADDMYRVNCLITLEGISPVLASIVLTFFDPKLYGVFDKVVWKPMLGNAPPGLYTAQNYVRYLAALRKTANKHNLDARIVEKAYYKKALDESNRKERVG